MDSGGSADEVAFDYELRPSDVTSVLRWRLTSQAYNWLVALAGLACVVFSAVLAFQPAGMTFTTVLVFVIGVADLGMLAISWARMPRLARSALAHEGPGRRIRLTAEGVEVKTPLTEVTLQWEIFGQVIERPNAYLLRRGGRNNYLVIPKRAFPDRDVEQRFRTLVSNHTKAQLQALAGAGAT